MTRDNDFIIKVLDYLKDENMLRTEEDVASEDDENNTCSSCNLDLFKYCVLLSTIMNDPETLKGLKKWSVDRAHDTKIGECDCPMVIACIENFNQCIQTLYDMKYRIRISEDYKTKIDQIIDTNYEPQKANRGSSIKQVLSIQKLNVDMEEQFPEEDVIVKLLTLKAYTNFNYFAAEFYEAMKETKEARDTNSNVTQHQREQLNLSDPMRKSLAIAHYIGSNIGKDITYRKEYKEIMKVKFP